MTDIKCPKCGAINDYYTELKANNNVARCSLCDTFIKNIPYQTEQQFFFGKYKGKKVSEIEDIQYLQWVLDKTNPKPAFRDAIIKQIDRFKDLAR